jgi:hypothetical protein
MFKKFMLTLIAAATVPVIFSGCCCKTDADKKDCRSCDKNTCKVDQTTEENAIISFWISVAELDMDILWTLLCPANKQAAIAKEGNEAAVKAKAAADLKEKITAEQFQKLKVMLKDPEQRKILVENVRKKRPGSFIQIDGKWYIDFAKLTK